MKQNYKAFAPDISSGGTTIKDVGKQRFSRKSSNSSKLWRLLICLMAIVMPVGAWAEGNGTSSDTPWSGNIKNVKITQGGDYYLAGTTDGQIRIETTGNVTLHIAGENKLHGTHITGIGETGSWPAIGTKNLSNLTIAYWDKDHKNTPSYLYLVAGNTVTNKEGLRLEGNCNLTITGPVAVVAQSGTEAPPHSPAVNMNNAIVTLKDGAYFSYNNAENPKHPDNWKIENFASAGDEALRQIGTKLGTNNPMQINVDFSQFTPSELYNDYVHGEIGTQKFITKATSDKFTLLVPSSNMNYYGELETDNEKLPFALRNSDGTQMPKVYAGAATSSGNYYAQIKDIQQGTYNLNVSQYPHSGQLQASLSDIIIKGVDDHKIMYIATEEGLELDGNNHTIWLKNITIPSPYQIKVNNDVRLGEKVLNESCFLGSAAKFNDTDVYYCIINYRNTDLEEKSDIRIYDESGTNPVNYPQTLDTEEMLIYAWLPKQTKFQIKSNNITREITTQTDHYQELYAADPVICINRNDEIKRYQTLSLAFKDVKDGETIYFTDNYKAVNGGSAEPKDNQGNWTITVNQTFTLNLNGWQLSISGHTDSEGKLPLISSGLGTLVIKDEIVNTNATDHGNNGAITGSYRIEGIVYTELANIEPHIEGYKVEARQASTNIKKGQSMPKVITYDINGAKVNATNNNTNKYCIWIPTTNDAIGPVKDEQGTIFAQIKDDETKNYSLIPLFDLNSYNITVGTDKVSYADDYEVTGYGTETDPAEIVTVAEDKYTTANILTVNGNVHVLLKDIYTSLQTTDGMVGENKISTKLVVTGNQTADIKTSGINSIGTIEIGDGSTLKFNQSEETPATANALRFFSISKSISGSSSSSGTGKLEVESGTLLAYIQDNAEDPIQNVTATYKGGSVRAKFAKNNNARFTDGTLPNSKNLYRVSFKVKDYYIPYNYEYIPEGGTTPLSGKVTSDKNGEIHLWMPKATLGGKVKFSSADQTSSPEEIIFSAVAENDDNIAPANIGLYPGDKIDANNKIGSFISLEKAFEAMEENQNYTVALFTTHSESNTTCEVNGSQVTIDLNGNTLTCHNVTFKTEEQNFMLITNKGTDSGSDKHATINGDIVVSQNVYIGKDVHMEGVHVDMINPTLGEEPYKNVRRLLVKGLEKGNTYTYEFADQKVGFTVGQQLTENSQTTGVACLWLVESMYPQEFVVYGESQNAENGLTVPGGELAIVAHSNGYTQLVKGGIVATVTVDTGTPSPYRTLSAAINAANTATGDKIVIALQENIQSQATFEITKDYAIDLNGHDLTFTQGGFKVTNKDNTLTISNNNKQTNSTLTGVINISGNGDVIVDENVTIGGVVLQHTAEGIKTVYRLIARGNDDYDNNWVETPERDTDVEIGNPATSLYTIPAGLANHNTTVTIYKVVTIGSTEQGNNWDNIKDCNIVVPTTQTWTVPKNEQGNTIHRLTIYEGGKVNTEAGKATATDGIRYIRTFTTKQWSLIALPYTATDITTTNNSGKVVSISPAANPGTSGEFWLHTIKSDGSTSDVVNSEMTANKVYVMKTPANMTVTFISGPNQMLKRNQELNPDPVSGFVAYANGTLNDVTLTKAFYKLDAEGKNFERVTPTTTTKADEEGAGTGASTNGTIAPFSGYLLADAATTQNVARFSLRSTPTANEEIEIAEDELQIRTEAGRIILTTETPVQVVICDLKGTVKFSGEIPAGDSSYEVGAGIYIINNQKVIVK
ncbi:hypothetical protein [Parabacteroides chongii]|nr:hypothetical protein [Parabacteroides chongii]WFE86547.1 hypothetical protein P3L47_08140 [Parabacteroides chongii]